MRRFQPTAADLDPVNLPVTACAASSVEPMPRPDHKAKKNSRPARKSEKLGGGHFVFRRHADGRIHPNSIPFEHPDFGAANDEAYRLVEKHGGTFEVYQCRNIVTHEEALAAAADELAASAEDVV